MGGKQGSNTFLAYFRRAYHPAQPFNGTSPTGYWASDQAINKIPIWASSGAGATTDYEYGYEMNLRSVLRGIIDQRTGTRIKFRTTGLTEL